MARIEIEGFDYLDKMLSDIGQRTVKAVEKGMEDAIPVLTKAEQESIRRAAGGKDTYIAKQIKGIRPIRHNAYGMFTAVGPVGVHHTYISRKTRQRVEVRNAEVAAYLEYGVKSNNQPPRPWVEPAKRGTEKQITESLQAAIDREVEKNG